MSDPLLIQYRAFSDQRIHFGRLYWFSIAFLFALLLSAASILQDTSTITLPTSLMAAGGLSTLMSFVAERLRRLECQYEDALQAIEAAWRDEGHANIQTSPRAGKFGARMVITTCLFLLGSLLLVLGLVGLVI